MKPVTLSSRLLSSPVPGLRCTAPVSAEPPAPAADDTSTVADDSAAAGLPAELRPGFTRSAAVDPVTEKVFVAVHSPDGGSVVRFASAEALEAGAASEAVFTLPVAGPNADDAAAHRTATAPAAMVCDSAGRLWVADALHHRVLRYDAAGDLPSGAQPSGVLGQAGFHGGSPGTSASRMHRPVDIAVDGHGRLYVADAGNARVLWFNDAARRSPGASANGVLGQTDFDARGPGGVLLKSPSRLAVEGGGRGRPVTLWVADAPCLSVLRFDNATALPVTGAEAAAVLLA